ncbi:QsdR family transcriptional regulator [Actinomadura madurae]|uniref:QsdR family transcriptional regulator n=1 Tax=Actinomadura madurae TaxID=1993 RepID=UPI000D8B0AD7|nr:QsdR family transcriptional regulator [Actinomadura madurae]MCP9947451.1 QsdR family transcriptional regulator [Actinomadura madurae]MCP9964213.1 QsdR family transcriptional regulator [Actinomadura madurae]MCP9976690.1 QsdR family transcriptional regulator [Actinomadura madurae]MCQ0011817.1 QsdR family transcriptional regulator [Actinomadura madurae]MCQ0012879.1 QsdR family transcriptional regulator [Actinomadura madurae]
MSGLAAPGDHVRPPSAPSGRPAGPAAALAAASAHYLRGEPIDMSALAAELGVGRATLYRWVGSREQLLGAVLGEMTERTYRVAARGVGGSGAGRILALLDRFMRAVVEAEPLKAFTEREPRLFIRLATMPGTIEDRATELLTKELQAEIDRGELRVRLPTRTLAQAIVRVADSFMYAHYLGGNRPEIDQALEVVELLLRPCGTSGCRESPGASER